jgi:predicted dehydrogenase
MADGKTPTVAVIGTGSIVSRHLRLLQAMGGVRAVAVPLRAERVAQWQQDGFTACTVEDARELELAGVIVCNDTAQHAHTAATWLERCPVLSEKPLAPTAADASFALEASRRHGRSLHVACNLRFDAGLRWIRERLPQLGRVTAVDAECLSWLPAWRPQRDFRETYSARAGEGGVLLDMIHEIDYCRWLFGECESLVATVDNLGILGLPSEVDEAVRLLWTGPDGLRVGVNLSYVARPTRRTLRVSGEQGMLEWDLVKRAARALDADGRLVDEYGWTGPDDMYRNQLAAWLAVLRGEDREDLSTGADGVATLRICDAARASSRLRQWVRPS